jgi:hypothetical protein
MSGAFLYNAAMKRFFMYPIIGFLAFILGLLAVRLSTPDRCAGVLYYSDEIKDTPIAVEECSCRVPTVKEIVKKYRHEYRKQAPKRSERG